jgi:hypothetical protein
VWISSKLILIGSEPYYSAPRNPSTLPESMVLGIYFTSLLGMHIGGYVFIFQIKLSFPLSFDISGMSSFAAAPKLHLC